MLKIPGRQKALNKRPFWERFFDRPSRWPLINNQHQQQNTDGKTVGSGEKKR